MELNWIVIVVLMGVVYLGGMALDKYADPKMRFIIRIVAFPVMLYFLFDIKQWWWLMLLLYGGYFFYEYSKYLDFKKEGDGE